jgi:hypothetical protein
VARTDEAPEPSPWVATGVPLAPLGNADVVGVASGRLLDADQCHAVLDGVAAASRPPPEPDASEVAALTGRIVPDAVGAWLLPMIGQAVTVANNQHFRFELTGILAPDPPLVITVTAVDGGEGDRLFCDLGPAVSTRKLSIVLPLEDGVGGMPEFPALAKTCSGTAGEVSIFPSYLAYRLVAVEGAPRPFLWARVHGPHFQ